MKHEGLKQEINATLMFFIDTDINIYGKISDRTKEAFKVQGVEIPKEYQKFI